MILATSIGVLSTTELNGASTVWIQEAATSIGNIITGYLDYRSSDKTLAVGTHARGIFTTQFEATSSIAVVGGWNVVSNPLNTDSDSVTVLFPSAISTAYRYDPLSGYQAASEMSNGLGYWLKFAVPEYISISGASSDSINIAVLPGWNLIGSVSEPVSTGAVLQNPPNNVTSLYYGYNGGYVQSDTIHPGKGYWVKVDQAGTLTLRSNASSMPPPDHDAHVKLLNMMSALTLTDASGCSQTLYFGEEPEWGSRPGLFELPPTPMDGIFDVRFASQRIAETYPSGFDREIEYRIAIWSAAYPLTISWKLSEIAPAAVLCTADGAGILWSDGPGISVVMKEESKVLVLRVSPSKPEPQEFRLAQNYPNPFNPRTEIRFSIPSTPGTLHATSLQIYDVVGREVATLVNDIRPPGSYEVTWDASGMPSGVYFCRLSVEPAASPYLASHRHNSQAGRFSEVRKLLLLK
jgi:hypothetical protein